MTENAHTHLVGKHFAPDAAKRDALVADGVPHEKIATKDDLPQKHRVLGPNSMTTMDFVPDRLNVKVGAAGVIESVKMG
ncbi:hypothetical protein HDU86_002919 [Geranomyces michiganensis]|nr:hypothetical protein HDU86_002919 [Geranomyces michiganensis]